MNLNKIFGIVLLMLSMLSFSYADNSANTETLFLTNASNIDFSSVPTSLDNFLGNEFVQQITLSSPIYIDRFEFALSKLDGSGTIRGHLEIVYNDSSIIVLTNQSRTAAGTIRFNESNSNFMNKTVSQIRLYCENGDTKAFCGNVIYYEKRNFNITNYYNSTSGTFNVSNDANIQNLLGNFEGGNSFNFDATNFSDSFITNRNNGTFNGSTFNNGALQNSPTRLNESSCINSTFGNCLGFDGVNDYVLINNESDFDLQTFTISYWINPGDLSVRNDLISKGEASYITSIKSSGFPNMWVNDGSFREIISNTSLTVGVWDYVTYTYDKSQSLYKVYINGLETGSIDPSSFGNLTNNALQLSIGIKRAGAPSNFFTGSLDEVRIWPEALTQSRILEEMDSTNPTTQALASLSFQEGGGDLAFNLNSFVQGNTTNERWNKALAFDGVDDHIIVSDDDSLDMTTEITISTWVKSTSTTTNDGIIGKRWSGETPSWFVNTGGGGTINWHVWDGGGVERTIVSSTDIHDGEWHNLMLFVNTTSQYIYVDGVLDSSISSITGIQSGNSRVSIGTYFSSGEVWEGLQDDIRIYNKSLTSTEINEIINNSFFNTTNLVASYNFEQLTNTVALDRATEYSYNATNIATPFNLQEGNFTSYFNNIYTGNLNFITLSLDITNPSLTNSLGAVYNITNRNILFNDFLTVTDSLSGIESCIVSVSDGTLTNCDDTYTFALAGNYTYNITVTDFAGNTNTSSSNALLVNPVQIFRFVDDNGDNVTNYNFNSVNFTNEAQLLLFDIGLGAKSLPFIKDGFIPSNFPLTFNLTSSNNLTFNVSLARIIINVFNQITGILINETLNLDLIGPTTLFTTSNDGTFNISSVLIAGPYQLFVTSDNFLAVQDNFIFNGSEIHEIDLYMLPTNSSQVGFINVLTYREDNTFFPEIPVTALEWDSATNTYIQTYSTFSNTNGIATIPIILENKIYKFCAEYPNGINCFPTSILGVTISLAQNGDTFPILPSLDFPGVPLNQGALQITIVNLTLSNFSDVFYSYQVDYTWNNTLGLTSTVCTRLEKDFNFSKTTIIDTCSSSASGIYSNNFLLNNSFNYIFSIYSLEGLAETEEYTEFIQGQANFFSFFDRFNITKLLQVALIAVMIGIIPFIKIPLLIVVDIIIAFIVAWKYVIPQEISIISVGVIIIMCGITLWVVSKK